MALQHSSSFSPGVLPEALARFAAGTSTRTSPLRALSYVAMGVDTIMILLALTAGAMLWGNGHNPLPAGVGILIVWIAVLAMRGAYDPSRISVGSEEFRTVIAATIGVFAMTASAAYLLDIFDGRRLLVGAFVAGVFLLPLGRRIMRQWVFSRRRAGRFMRRTLVVGEGAEAADISDRLSRDSRGGFEVVQCITGPPGGVAQLDLWLDFVEQQIESEHVDALAVTHTHSINSEVIRRLSWRLEGPNVDLLVAPALGDVTGPRLNVRPAAGLPLLHLEEPRLTGPQWLVKRGSDVVLAGLGLLVTAPLMLLIAAGVRLTSSGPAVFVQERVGQAGRTYRLVKFRTMFQGSDNTRLETLGSLAGDIESYKDDPRITPLGKFLRRWSLDELPQLWNVLTGSMSLVGPRPMLVDELPLLGTNDHRRHLTKPGMTGLWQVAGRKEIEWNERMQMDLRYVENWSPALDAVILLKTFKAVATGRGAH